MKNLKVISTVVKQEKKLLKNKVFIEAQVTELGKATKLTLGTIGYKKENGKPHNYFTNVASQ